MSETIPVVLFAYARPAHLARVLACLRENAVPLIYAYADGEKGPADAERVGNVRALLCAVDWCEVRLTERRNNIGLGASVLAGVSEVAAKHDAFIVWEDDLICVPGTYAWVSAALRSYKDDRRVMSVSAWTHPRVTPANIGDQPYFDRRADCWVWGAWARSWRGMTNETALSKMHATEARGLARDSYGSDLPEQAAGERKRNVWAVRWLYHHLQNEGLCLRPPWSMVEHIGFDISASNAAGAVEWANPPLRKAPAIPANWPIPAEHPACRNLWTEANPQISPLLRIRRRFRHIVGKSLGRLSNKRLRDEIRLIFGWRWFRGDHLSWASAKQASIGYDDAAILERAIFARREVRAGRAMWERDGTLFYAEETNEPLLKALAACAKRSEPLVVVDFGGALGSTWWQHRVHLAALGLGAWRVVEQESFVRAGAEFANDILSFHTTLEEACAGGAPTVILFSSVLQYIEAPWDTLHAAAQTGCASIVLDRTPFVKRGGRRLRVQHTPPRLGGGTYPCWHFTEDDLMAPLVGKYKVIDRWAGADHVDSSVCFRGLLLQRILPREK